MNVNKVIEFYGLSFEPILAQVFSEILGLEMKPINQFMELLNSTHYSEKNKLLVSQIFQKVAIIRYSYKPVSNPNQFAKAPEKQAVEVFQNLQVNNDDIN